MTYTKDEYLANQSSFKPFQINGETYHKQELLRASTHQTPSYAQLFFFNPDYAANIHATRNPQCKTDLLQDLTTMLQEHNPYILMYKTMQKKLDAQSQSVNPLR